MSRVFIVRHGNTFDKGDIVLRVGGRTDLPLSVSGRQQAARLKVHFEGHLFGNSFSSDLKRTKETIETILSGQPYQIADLLTEIDYGPDEGRPEEEVIARLGRKALTDWDDKSIPPTGWIVNPTKIREGWLQFLARCPQKTDTLVVTSNGVARFLLDIVSGGALAPKKLRTGAYGVISLDQTGPRLLKWDIRPTD